MKQETLLTVLTWLSGFSTVGFVIVLYKLHVYHTVLNDLWQLYQVNKKDLEDINVGATILTTLLDARVEALEDKVYKPSKETEKELLQE